MADYTTMTNEQLRAFGSSLLKFKTDTEDYVKHLNSEIIAFDNMLKGVRAEQIGRLRGKLKIVEK